MSFPSPVLVQTYIDFLTNDTSSELKSSIQSDFNGSTNFNTKGYIRRASTFITQSFYNAGFSVDNAINIDNIYDMINTTDIIVNDPTWTQNTQALQVIRSLSVVDNIYRNSGIRVDLGPSTNITDINEYIQNITIDNLRTQTISSYTTNDAFTWIFNIIGQLTIVFQSAICNNPALSSDEILLIINTIKDLSTVQDLIDKYYYAGFIVPNNTFLKGPDALTIIRTMVKAYHVWGRIFVNNTPPSSL